MRRFVLICLALSSCLAFAADAPSLAQAASERMLAERLAKTYAWRALEPNSREAQAQYEAASKLFTQQLATLRAASHGNADLDENYALLEQLWGDYKAQTAATPTPEGAKALADASEEVAWIAQKGSQMIEQRSNAGARTARVAQDVATLSQRLAKIYLLECYGTKRNFLKKDLIDARAEFDMLDAQLKAASNTNSRKGLVALMDSQWFFFQQAIDELAKNNAEPQLRRNVITTSDHIAEVAAELATSYQRP